MAAAPSGLPRIQVGARNMSIRRSARDELGPVGPAPATSRRSSVVSVTTNECELVRGSNRPAAEKETRSPVRGFKTTVRLENEAFLGMNQSFETLHDPEPSRETFIATCEIDAVPPPER